MSQSPVNPRTTQDRGRMRRWISSLLAIVVALPSLVSCKAVSSIFDDGRVIAKVGQHKLSRSEVATLVPPGTSPEDSLRLVMQYINSWASDLVYADIAEAQLSKQEKDVTRELEEYRKALLKYRYEQRYVNERLDTSVTLGEVEAYYDAHKQDFIAEVPVVRARFMRISADSPHIETIKKKMSSDNIDDIVEADSLAGSSADRYTAYGDRWVAVTEVAKDFGKDYGSLLSLMRNSFIQVKDTDYDKLNVAYIRDFIAAGEPLPVEYCEAEIKGILVGIRRHRLVTDLEQELLEDAREKGKFVIY